MDIARKEGADAIAHGATGKGNDQVRFEFAAKALAPDLKVIAPWREWDLMSRTALNAFAEKHGIPISKEAKRYSMDANMMHTSFEGSELEDPGNAPHESCHERCVPVEQAPNEPEIIEVSFEHGNPVAVNGEKMSKSRGNVVNPNDIVAQYGADTMRLHIMFIGDFEKAVTWSNEAVKGSKRFLDRCWNLMDLAQDSDEISEKNEALIHKTIKKVTADIDDLKMNTAIAALMAMVNEFYSSGLTRGDLQQLMLLLSPFAPHMVEEMWELTGYAAKTGKMAMQMPWPTYDEGKTVDTHVDMAIQVNGKLKGAVTVPAGSGQETVMAAAMELDKVRKAAEGMTVVKTILVKDKLMNLIVKPAK